MIFDINIKLSDHTECVFTVRLLESLTGFARLWVQFQNKKMKEDLN